MFINPKKPSCTLNLNLVSISVNIYILGVILSFINTPTQTSASIHIAWHTFVCIAIESDIPESVIMKITGHKTYQAMLPYIDVAGVTVRKELLSKWKLPTAIEPKKSDTIEGYTIEQLTQLAKLLKQGLV